MSTPAQAPQPIRRWTVEFTVGLGRRRQTVTAPTQAAACEIAAKYNPGAVKVRVVGSVL